MNFFSFAHSPRAGLWGRFRNFYCPSFKNYAGSEGYHIIGRNKILKSSVDYQLPKATDGADATSYGSASLFNTPNVVSYSTWFFDADSAYQTNTVTFIGKYLLPIRKFSGSVISSVLFSSFAAIETRSAPNRHSFHPHEFPPVPIRLNYRFTRASSA